MSVEQLVQMGYSGLDVLDVTTTTSNTSQFIDALSFWSERPATIRMRADWEFEFAHQPTDGRHVRFAVRSYRCDVFEQVFRDPRATVHQIQRLVLPSSFGQGRYAPPRSTLLASNAVLALPALRTLVLECGGMRTGDNAFPLTECILGKLEAPHLARVELVRAADAPRDAQLDPVDTVRT